MKKVAIITAIITIMTMFLGLYVNQVFATERILDEQTESQLIQIKENEAKTLEEYKIKYGSDTYGFTAYILNMIRIYSIPLCFLLIAISAIYQYVIGIRKLDNQEKGLALMVTTITILIICQILPLAFAIVVKFGRG